MKNCLALSKQLKKWKYICTEVIFTSGELRGSIVSCEDLPVMKLFFIPPNKMFSSKLSDSGMLLLTLIMH